MRTVSWFPSKAELSVLWTSQTNTAECGINTTATLHGHYHYGLRQMTLTGNSTNLGHMTVTCQLDGVKRSLMNCRMPLNPAVLCEEVILQRS